MESYRLELDVFPDYLHVRVFGKHDLETISRLMADTRTACERYECYRVLIEICFRGPRMDDLEIFSLVSEYAAEWLGHFQEIVVADSAKSVDTVRFIETIGANRGLPIRILPTIDEARQAIASSRFAKREPIPSGGETYLEPG